MLYLSMKLEGTSRRNCDATSSPRVEALDWSAPVQAGRSQDLPALLQNTGANAITLNENFSISACLSH